MSRTRLTDLSQDETLDRDALARVRGGLYVGDQPSLGLSARLGLSGLTCPVHRGPRYSIAFGQHLYDASPLAHSSSWRETSP